jgi:hypothetical protein
VVARTADRVGALVVALVGALLAAPPIRDTDWGWHVAQGERVLVERALPWDDVWMWTTDGLRAAPYAWLFDVLLALAERAAGVAGVAAFGVVGCVLLGSALRAGLRALGAPPWPATALAAATLLAVRLRLVPRPHVVGDLFFVVTVALLLRGRWDGWRGRPWLVPALVALWANLHPSALLGVATFGVLLAGEALRARLGAPGRGDPPPATREALLRLALIVAASGLAAFATPLGLGQVEFLHQNQTKFAAVVELRPLDWRQDMDRGAILTAALVALPALLAGRPRRDPTPWLVALAFGLLAARTSRFFVEWLLFTALAAAPAYAGAGRRSRALAGALLALALGPLLVRAGAEQVGLGLSRPLLDAVNHCPTTADFLASTPVPDPLFNSNRLGGYLVYRLRGRPQVFWDGRMPFNRFLDEVSFEALHARLRFRTLVLAEREVPVTPETEAGDADWVCVHFDDEARVFVDARDPLAARGLRFARFRWERTAGSIDRLLVPDLEHPAEAAAELEGWARQQPDGYYAHLALGRARLALGDRSGARAAAEVADRKRSTTTSRALLAASQ